MSHRFARSEILLGARAMELLAQSRLVIFGLGGVGSYAAEALARSGVGSFILVDPDTVDITNINRQIHALSQTVGQAKVYLMAQRMREINPEVNVESRCERLNRHNSGVLLEPGLTYVVDAIDDVDSKVHLLKECVERGIPVISAMGAGNKLDPTLFRVDDISKTKACPLARVIRRQLRKENIYSGVQVVYSTESPVPVQKKRDQYDHTAGSVAFVPPVVGMIMAGVVIKDISRG